MIKYNLRYRLKTLWEKTLGVTTVSQSYWDKVDAITSSIKEFGLNIESRMGFPDGTVSYIINVDSADDIITFLIKYADVVENVEITEF